MQKEYLSAAAEVLSDQGVDENLGLSDDEASSRLAKTGPNKLEEAEKTPLWKRFFEQMADPMVIMLIVAAVISALTGMVKGEADFADVAIIMFVVIVNSVLGVVRQWQTMFYGSSYSQTDPHRKTDYVKLADAFGARGFRVSNIAELRDALREAMKRTGPVLIDAQIDKDERVLPMIPAGGTVDDLVTE